MSRARGRRRRPACLAAALAASSALLAAALAATAASGAYGVTGAAAAAAVAAVSSSSSSSSPSSPSSSSSLARRSDNGDSFFFGGSSNSVFEDEDEESGQKMTSPYIVELVPGSKDGDVTSLCERLEAGEVVGGGGGGGGGRNGDGKGNSSSSSSSSSSNKKTFARCGRHLYRSVFFGALVHGSPGVAAVLEREPGVASVHPDDLVALHSDGGGQGGAGRNPLAPSPRGAPYPRTQLHAPWHLARLSSPEPLSKRRREGGGGGGGGGGAPSSFNFDFSAAGSGVSVFVVDTGVFAGHAEFRWSPSLAPLSSSSSSPSSSSSSRVRKGFSVFERGPSPTSGSPPPVPPEDEDCVGHGTHVAALAAGLTFGLAKNATVVPVRVVGCDGAAAVSDVVAGLDWISSVLFSGHGNGGENDGDGDDDDADSASSSPFYSLPAVVSLSVGSSRPSPVLDRAAQALVDGGALVVAAAGNAAADACGASPGRLPSALTVGASDRLDGVWPSSNFGPCVDLHAPGVDVTSATSMHSGGIEGGGGGETFSSTNTAVASGTSMAAPIVSGAAAAFMEAWPGVTPAEVHERIVLSAAKGFLRWGSGNGARGAASAAAAAEANTANLLLQAPPPPRPALAVSPSSLPPVVLFESAADPGGKGEDDDDNGGEGRGIPRGKLVLSLPPPPSGSEREEDGETPFEVKVDFLAGGAPAGWISVSPSSGALSRGNPTATIELAFDASAAAGFSSPLSLSSLGALSADVVVTSRGKLAARRRASARVFCSKLALAPRGGARRVTRMDFLESWDEAAGPPGKRRWSGGGPSSAGYSSSSPSSSSSSWVSATLAVALSHPVAADSLPEGAFVVNGGAGEVVSVAQGGGGGGRSCSEWIIRVRAPASSTSSPSSSKFSAPSAHLCVSLSPRGVLDVWGAPFGSQVGKKSENCTEVRLAPRLRLFAPFAAAEAPEVAAVSSTSSPRSSNLLSVEAQVGASEGGGSCYCWLLLSQFRGSIPLLSTSR